jgi:hypothetical protein
VVLEKDGDQLDWSCEKWRSITESQRGEMIIVHTVKLRKANWIGHIWLGSCFWNT